LNRMRPCGLVRPLPVLAGSLVLAGVALLGYAAAIGQAQVVLVLIVPVVVGSGPWAFAGMLLLMTGFLAGFWAAATRRGPTGAPPPRIDEAPGPAPPRPAAPKQRVAGFVLVGPIPIAFGSTKALAATMLLLALVALLLLLVAPALWGRP